jgi:hypothetical protein
MNFKGKYGDNGNSGRNRSLILTVKDRLKTKYGASEMQSFKRKQRIQSPSRGHMEDREEAHLRR